jgi:hypothetical protein
MSILLFVPMNEVLFHGGASIRRSTGSLYSSSSPIKLLRPTLDHCRLASRDAANRSTLEQNRLPRNAIRGNGHFFLEIGYSNEAPSSGINKRNCRRGAGCCAKSR